MKSILLSGGRSSRVFPLNLFNSKHLLPVYDKPMIAFSLCNLMELGSREICLISTPEDAPLFKKYLGNGSHLGISIEYREQETPDGIASAFIIAKSFIGDSNQVILQLADNLIISPDVVRRAALEFNGGAQIFTYEVARPSDYGILNVDCYGRIESIEEKPKVARSNQAVVGLYYYDNRCVEFAEKLKPSKRQEKEITDLNNEYLKLKELKYTKLKGVWLDQGSAENLHEASAYIQVIQKRQGISIGNLEETALKMGYITKEELAKLVSTYPQGSAYTQYLNKLIQ